MVTIWTTPSVHPTSNAPDAFPKYRAVSIAILPITVWPATMDTILIQVLICVCHALPSTGVRNVLILRPVKYAGLDFPSTRLINVSNVRLDVTLAILQAAVSLALLGFILTLPTVFPAKLTSRAVLCVLLLSHVLIV